MEKHEVKVGDTVFIGDRKATVLPASQQSEVVRVDLGGIIGAGMKTNLRTHDLSLVASRVREVADRLEDYNGGLLSLGFGVTDAEIDAIRCAADIVQKQSPIPVSERLPPLVDGESEAVMAYHPTSEYWGEAWLIDTRLSDDDELEWLWMNDRISGPPSLWMPKPPKPE